MPFISKAPNNRAITIGWYAKGQEWNKGTSGCRIVCCFRACYTCNGSFPKSLWMLRNFLFNRIRGEGGDRSSSTR
jgi:hypothetical protein